MEAEIDKVSNPYAPLHPTSRISVIQFRERVVTLIHCRRHSAKAERVRCLNAPALFPH